MKKIIALLSIILLSSCSGYIIKEKPQKTLLISHKGIWKDNVYPANSMMAFDEALRQGFDGFELDVMLTSDDVFVVIHDEKLDHTTNCKGDIIKTDSGDLKKCSVKKNVLLPASYLMIKKTKNIDKIASLQEVFAKYLPNENLKKIVIDIKTTDASKIIIALNKALPKPIYQQYGQKIIFIGKSDKITKSIKDHFSLSLVALEGNWGSEPVIDYKKYLNHQTHDLVSLNAELMFGHLKKKDYFSNIKDKNKDYLENYFNAAKAANMPTMAWTINNKKNYKYLLSKEVEIILTDLRLNP